MAGDDLLEATMLELAPALSLARHDWWVIAGVAVRLHCGADLLLRDIDLLIDPADVAPVFAALGLKPVPGEGDGRFRSEVFARYTDAPLPVELFAGFELNEGGKWRAIKPRSRVRFQCGKAVVYVPDSTELADMLRRFGREKDLARAELLSASGRSPSTPGKA